MSKQRVSTIAVWSLLSALLAFASIRGITHAATPEYSIEAIRIGTFPQFGVSRLAAGATADEKLDLAAVIWLIRGDGRNILFDSGFHRPLPGFAEPFRITDFVRPDEGVKLAGVRPEQITDIIISHVHWDHMGGIDLFPAARIWIQKDEYQYYMGESWQPGGKRGAEIEDLMELLRRNAAGKVMLVNGDDKEILPGIRVYTGGRHTFASQFIRVEGTPAYVLTSDNLNLYRNIDARFPAGTFDVADRASNIAAIDRMISLAGAKERVVPGHDMLQFTRYKSAGRVAKIK